MRKGFTRLPNWLLDDKELRKSSVFWVLSHLISKPPNWKFYRKPLARETGLTLKSLDRALKKLKELGYLQIKRISLDNYEWRIIAPQDKNGDTVWTIPFKGMDKNGDTCMDKNGEQNKTITKTEEERRKILSASFNDVWKVYPRKQKIEKSKEVFFFKVKTSAEAKELLNEIYKYRLTEEVQDGKVKNLYTFIQDWAGNREIE